jgi:hypothetical protein
MDSTTLRYAHRWWSLCFFFGLAVWRFARLALGFRLPNFSGHLMGASAVYSGDLQAQEAESHKQRQG